MSRKHIYCCDWGTTSLRTRLVDPNTFEIIHQATCDAGIASTFEGWTKNQTSGENTDRITFYLSHLKGYFNTLANKADVDPTGIPVVLSGMASSSIGIRELPYADVPYALDGTDAIVHKIEPSQDFNHPVFILSGVKDGGEVMRGEEMPLSGLQEIINKLPVKNQFTVVLPGTHSKHVTINKGRIATIATYVTGELFDILTANGLLKHAVEKPQTAINQQNWKVFLNGIECSGESPLLQSLFRIRTNELLGKLTRTANYYFLSGLLIGYELRSLLTQPKLPIVLCSEQNLFDHYQKALEYLGLADATYFLPPEEVEKITVRGQVVTIEPHLIL